MAAVLLVVLGAIFGPAARHLSPNEVRGYSVGREVVVGGIVVESGQPTKSGTRPYIILSKDGSRSDDTVRVEYTGERTPEFSRGAKAVFVGTVKYKGVVRARQCVEVVKSTPAVDQAVAAP